MTETVPKQIRHRVKTPVGTKSRTKQAMGTECDINAILRRHAAGGGLEHLNTREAYYGDFSDVGDYHTSMNRVKRAEATFAALPAHVRDHCRNDPAELVKMALDPDRVDEMVDLGLLPESDRTPEPKAPTPPQKPQIPKAVSEEEKEPESKIQGGD